MGMERYQNKLTAEPDLWEAFKKGDKEAYATIYDRHAGAMYTYGLRFTNDEELIEDTIHDIFVKIYKKKENLPEVSNIKLYLMIALRNTLFDKLTKNQVEFRLNIVEEMALAEADNAEAQLIRNEQETFHRKIIDKMEAILSPRQKQIIYYRYVEQLSYKEISRVMNINTQSAKNMVQISLKKIRSHFSGSLYTILVALLIN